MKQLFFVCILAAVLLLFGCINLNDDSLKKMDLLQQKYFVKTSFSPSTSTMTEYISAISELRRNASQDNKKIIESEVYLAESFNYESRAMRESSKLTTAYFDCSNESAKAMINYINLSSNSLSLAKESYSNLTDQQKEKLRSNYSELLDGIEEQINLMKDFVDDKC